MTLQENDCLRKRLATGTFEYFMASPSVQDLPNEKLQQLLIKVRTYNAFSPEDTEHSKGIMHFDGETYMWRIFKRQLRTILFLGRMDYTLGE